MVSKPAFILAGGQSRRFGRDKTALQVRGRLLLADLVATLHATGHEVCILGPQESHLLSLGCTVLPDFVQFDGALAAIAHVLAGEAYPHALIVAADMPFLHPDLVRHMWGHAQPGRAVLLEGAVLPAIYPKAALPLMRAVLGRGERRIQHFHTQLGRAVHCIPQALWKMRDPEGRSLLNLNTLADWEICQNYLKA